ncbi:MAG: hypothetical protein WAV10_02700 [Minisyncoccia bacterium]
MNFNPEKNFNNKKFNPLLDEKLLLSEIINESGEKLKDQAKIEKISELTRDLLFDETIIRQEQLDSENPNLEKIKADATLEIKKKIKFYIENENEFLECRKIFSNAKNLQEFFKIKKPLKEIAGKIGLNYNPITISNKQQEPKTSLERPSEIFKLAIDPEYIKTKRIELHNIKGLYRPFRNNPDGGDGWYVKKIDNKKINTLIDTFGHGLASSYTKLFILKTLSLAENDEDLFDIENFLLEIDDASGTQFQLNAAMLQIEEDNEDEENPTLNIKMNQDMGVIIYNPKTNKMTVIGMGAEYPGITSLDSIKKFKAIGGGANSKSDFKNSVKIKINKDDKVFGFSDECRGAINNALKENKNNAEKINEMPLKIKSHTHKKSDPDDSSWWEIR